MAAPSCLAKKAVRCLYQNSAAVGNREELSSALLSLKCNNWHAQSGFAFGKLNSLHQKHGYTAALQMSQNESLGQSSLTKTEQSLQ